MKPYLLYEKLHHLKCSIYTDIKFELFKKMYNHPMCSMNDDVQYKGGRTSILAQGLLLKNSFK